MFRGGIVGLALVAGLAACAAPPPRPSGRPVARAAPAATPASLVAPTGVAARVQREAWLTRFWEQLTPRQRQRVLAKLRQGDPPMRPSQQQAARVWDAIGLPERDALVFGPGLPRSRLVTLMPELTAAGPRAAP